MILQQLRYVYSSKNVRAPCTGHWPAHTGDSLRRACLLSGEGTTEVQRDRATSVPETSEVGRGPGGPWQGSLRFKRWLDTTPPNRGSKPLLRPSDGHAKGRITSGESAPCRGGARFLPPAAFSRALQTAGLTPLPGTPSPLFSEMGLTHSAVSLTGFHMGHAHAHRSFLIVKQHINISGHC